MAIVGIEYAPCVVPPDSVNIGVVIGQAVFWVPVAIESEPTAPFAVEPLWVAFHVTDPSALSVRVPLVNTPPCQPNVSPSELIPVAL